MRNAFHRSLSRRFAAGGGALLLAASCLFSSGEADAAGRPWIPDLAESNTRYSAELRQADKRYGSERHGALFVAIDRDMIDLNSALREDGIDSPGAAAAIIAQYVEEQAGIALPPDSYADLAKLVRNSAHHNMIVQHYEVYAGVPEERGQGCFIVTRNPDKTDERQVKENLLNLNPHHHGALAQARLKKDIDAAAQMRFTFLHETMHCHDRKYIPAATRAARGEDILLRHKAELFAEIGAAFRMAQEGITDIAGQRAEIRLAGMFLGGPVSHAAPVRDSPGADSGYVYALHEGLRTAQKKIDAMGDGIRALTLEQIVALTEETVEASAFSLPAADSIRQLWESGFDPARLDETGLEIRAQMNRALPLVLDMPADPQGRDPVDAVTFNLTPPRGNPGAAPTPAERAIVNSLKDEILRRAGPAEDRNAESLIRGYESLVNDLRQDLASGGDGRTERAAAHKLSLKRQALGKALFELKHGPEPSQEELERRLKTLQQKNGAAPGP